MSSASLSVSDLAPGLVLGEDVVFEGDVQLGANVVIHSGVVLGDGCVVQDGVVLGKTPVPAPHFATPLRPDEPLIIGAGAAVCAGAIVFAGARIGAGAIVGDQANVRERAVVGDGTVIGRGSAVGNDTSIGRRVRIQTGVWLTAYSIVEDDVFLGPGVLTTNDETMARCRPGCELRGPRLRRACRVGAGVVLTPGVEIGEEAFVGAGALVTQDLPARSVAFGSPARVVGTVPDEQLLEHWR